MKEYFMYMYLGISKHFQHDQSIEHAGWPHSSRNKIPCVFPEFSLCYINFPCVIFMQKLTISPMNKGHITTVLLHTEVYKLIF